MTVDKSKEDMWRAMQERNGRRVGDGSSSGGGNGPSAGSLDIKDYVDIKTDALESKLFDKLDLLPSTGTLWGAVATGTAIILGVLAFAGDRFDAGISTAEQRFEQLQRDHRQDAAAKQIDEKLDILIEQSSKTK